MSIKGAKQKFKESKLWFLGNFVEQGGKDTQLTDSKASQSSVTEESNQRSPTDHKQFPVMSALAVPPGVLGYSDAGGINRVASMDQKTRPWGSLCPILACLGSLQPLLNQTMSLPGIRVIFPFSSKSNLSLYTQKSRTRKTLRDYLIQWFLTSSDQHTIFYYRYLLFFLAILKRNS